MALHADKIAIGKIVEDGLFQMVYQPIVSPRLGYFACAEAFIRLCGDRLPAAHRHLDAVRFTELVEETGLHVKADLRIVETVLREQEEYGGPKRLPVYINLCPSTLASRVFYEKVQKLVQRYNVSPALITFEIHEKSLVDRFARDVVLPGLYAAGVRFAVNNLISGHLNFIAMTVPWIETIKVDRCITTALETSELARKMLRSLQLLAGSLDKHLIAVGVENYNQYQLLNSMGCIHYQGVLFSDPLEARECLSVESCKETIKRSLQRLDPVSSRHY